MNAPRKRRDGAATQLACTPPPEAFDYEADITADAVRAIQDRADRQIKSEEWEVVDGYAGGKR